VIKWSILAGLSLVIFVLGLQWPAMPPDPHRDPVPPSQKVAHSIHCSGCHGFDETGLALVDSEGRDVNIYDDWRVSMMGLSAHDPFWRATLQHEVAVYPDAKSSIESNCLRCHAPIGSIQSGLNGIPYSYEMMLQDSLGLDGVSCSACHQQPVTNLGKGHSGFFTVDTNRVMFGPYPNPFTGPMQLYVGFEPKFSDHILNSGVCAGCHTLITQTLEPDGSPSGNYFVEQATFHEWVNSIYQAQGKECQFCHVPFINDPVIIATDFLALEERFPFGLHQFFGANTAMLELMKEHRKELGIQDFAPVHSWDETIENNRTSLQSSAVLSIDDHYVGNDTLRIFLEVQNKTGHKLPSGYPSRLAWLQVILTVHGTHDTLYVNGLMDEAGQIAGRDLPFEPHHEVSRNEDDVQVYEMVMGDQAGHQTTRLSAAHTPLKDNRLLPVGFSRTHPVYDTVAIWGHAETDEDYSARSQFGLDRIEYRIPLHGQKGFGDLHISLLYQTIPSRWMTDLFAHDTIPQVAHFRSMYADYEQYYELLDEIRLDQIDLSTTGTSTPKFRWKLSISPNPVQQNELRVLSDDLKTLPFPLSYQILSQDGMVKQSGDLPYSGILQTQLTSGLYYIRLSASDGKSMLLPFIRL
jgi:hypothetical protein